MSSIDDMPEHYREDFIGYEPDSPYHIKSQEIAYFKNPESLASWPKTYGEQNPPNEKDVWHLIQLTEEVNTNSAKTLARDKFTLAWHYEHGIDSNLSNIHSGDRNQDYIKAIELYENIYKHSSNFPDTDEGYYIAIGACHQIGVLYEKGGHGITKDYSMAAKWYLNGIELTQNSDRLKLLHLKKDISTYVGTRDSHITLARLYIEGLGVEEDHKRAIQLLSTYKLSDRNFPNLSEELLSNEGLKCQMFSMFYSSKFFVNTYGGPGIYSEEDSYFISEQEIKTLWKKWIKKAIDHGNLEAIEEYAEGLDQSHVLQYFNPEDKEEFYNAYKDTLNSLHYFRKLSEMEENSYYLEQYNNNLSMTLHSIYKFAIKAEKYDELKKNENN
jgi:TPR repeat protein